MAQLDETTLECAGCGEDCSQAYGVLNGHAYHPNCITLMAEPLRRHMLGAVYIAGRITDECSVCGRNFRDGIHFRAGERS